ncbi:MAG: glycosyltransferase family 9 protein [Rhodospirillales bacterium]
MNLLFITATRIGDAVLSSGLLAALIEQHPGARVTVACGRPAAELFQTAPGLERIIIIDKMAASLHWLEVWARCVTTRWDIIVDLRGAPLIRLLAARRTLRPARIARGAPEYDEHRVIRAARLINRADNPPPPALWPREGDAASAEQLTPKGPPVIAFGPGANWTAKMWPQDRFAELYARMTDAGGPLPGARAAVFGAGEERPGALRFIESVPLERRIDLMGEVDLLTAFACLKRCALYIGNDSGLMHLAAAAGIPVLGLFGPSLESRYAPWGPKCAAVRGGETYHEIFPEGFDHRAPPNLMTGLSVEQVESAARELLARAETA